MGYIFEAEVEAIINSVRARTIGEAEHITLEEVLESPIHPALKAYFRAEVERLLQEERAKEVRSKKFPYANPEVVSLQRQIDRLLLYRYQFDQHEFNALLDQAVHFQFNYLCRPQWTLMNFLFEQRRRIQAGDIERKLRYCVDYSYFSELVQRYHVERGVAEVEYEEFQKIIATIDAEVVAQHSNLELARMTRALTAFVEESLPAPRPQEEPPALPINAAVVFFEDKKLYDIQKQLEEERNNHGVTAVTVAQLAAIIGRVREDRPVAEEKEALPPPQPEIPEHARRMVSEPMPKPKPSSVYHGDLVFEVKQIETAPTDGEIRRPFESVDVAELFTSTERKRFVRKIFRKSEVAFREALDRFHTLETWGEASHYLDELFVANDVDAFSKEAVAFTDKIYAWYHPDQPAR